MVENQNVLKGPDESPDEERLDLFLEEHGSDQERLRLEELFADDDAARRALVARHRERAVKVPMAWREAAESRGLTASRSSSSRQRLVLLAAAVTFLAVGATLILRPRPSDPLDVVLRSPATAPGPVELVQPDSGARVPAGRVKLTFLPLAGAFAYDAYVLDPEGNVVAHAEGRELPLWVELAAYEGPLFWFVEGHRPGGDLKSELRSIHISP